MFPVGPLLLWDHSFVVADCGCSLPLASSTTFRRVHKWCALYVDAFADDVQSSQLIAAAPDDVQSGVDCYNSTLRALLDKHAPMRSNASQTVIIVSLLRPWLSRRQASNPKIGAKLPPSAYCRVWDSLAAAVWNATSTVPVKSYSVLVRYCQLVIHELCGGW